MTRLRYLDERVTVSGPWEGHSYYKDSCSSPITDHLASSGTSSYQYGSYRHMFDTVTPNFKKNKGSVYMNPMSSCQVKIGPPSGSTTARIKQLITSCSPSYYQDFEVRYSGFNFGGLTSGFNFSLLPDGSLSLPSFIISDGDVDRAIREASTSVWNSRSRSDSNLYETLAEAHKSHALLADIFGNGLKVLNRKAHLFARARDAGSAYLAYRYGLKPIMLDAEAVLNGLHKDVGTVRRTSRARVQLNSSTVTQSAASTGGMYTYTKNFNNTEVTTVRAMSLDESYVTLSQNIGFTDKGLITLPWELMPYSFVIDWFANVGDFIGSLVPTPELRQLGTCFVVERHMTTNYWASNFSSISPWSAVTAPYGSATRECISKYRVPGIAGPSLLIKSDFRFDNLTRAADAAALLAQKLRG